MSNGNKMLLAIFGVALAVLAIQSSQSVENFAGLGVSFKLRSDLETGNSKGQFFSVPGTYQAILSPRFSALNNYGSFIRYNMPSLKNQGVPKDPLTFSNMVKENYSTGGGCGAESSYVADYQESQGDTPYGEKCPRTDTYMGGNQSNITNYAATNYNELKNNLQYTEPVDLLPVGTMDVVSASGEVQQPIVYNRLMYANQKSRLYGRADYVRGDLAIVPCGPDWFRPAVNPQIDLNQGAMMVLAGSNNETSNQLFALQQRASGNTMTAFAGAPVTMATLKESSATNGGGDLYVNTVTAFP